MPALRSLDKNGTRPSASHRASVPLSPVNDEVSRHLEKWQKDLIDLSRRNKLINLRSRGGVIDIEEPSIRRVIDELTSPGSKGWRFHYPPPDPEELEEDPNLASALEAEDPDLTEELQDDELLTNISTGAQLSKRLRTLAARASTVFMDRGLRVLYLTVGVLKWSDAESTKLESPLLLIPVQLTRASPRDPFRLEDAEEDWTVNPALSAKLEADFELQLPALEGENIDAFLEAVKQSLSRYPGWVVEPRMSIAALSFSKETMYRDLKDNEAEILASETVQALAGRGESRERLQFEPLDPSAERLDAEHPPESLHSILDADGTQRACIVAAKQGKSFVMDGPPGSGKSQTIANVIAELLGDGKTVLFVSEKAAALEVVKNRLDQAHLGEFVLELHSHKATRKAVAAALGESIRTRLEVPRTRVTDERALRQRRIQLSTYAAAINERRFLSPEIQNLHDAIGRVGQLRRFPTLHLDQSVIEDLTPDRFMAALDCAQRLGGAWAPISRGEDFLWRELASSTLTTPIAQLNAQIDEVIRRFEVLRSACIGFCDQLGIEEPETFDDAKRLAEASEYLELKPVISPCWFDGRVDELLGTARKLHLDTIAVQNATKELVAAGLDLDLLPGDDRDLAHLVVAATDIVKVDEPLSQLEGSSAASAAVATAATSLEEAVGALSEEVGVNLGPATVQVAAQLLQLVDLGQRAHRPVREWLDSAQLGQVQAALRVVQPLVDEWKQTERRLKEHFNDNIGTVDINAFYDSDSDVQPKLGRVSGRGRANRKQLAACIKSGKVSDEAVALLPVARSWRSLTTRLEALQEASLLGPYFKGAATEVDAIGEALAAAEEVLALVGHNADMERVGRVVGFSQAISAEMKRHRVELEACLAAYDKATKAPNLLSTPAAQEELGAVSEQQQNLSELVGSLVSEARRFVDDDRRTVAEAQQFAAQNVDRIRAKHAVETAEGVEDLTPFFDGLQTDWDALLAALEWTQRMTRLVPETADPRVAEAVEEASRDHALEGAVASLLNGIGGVQQLFSSSQQTFLDAILMANLGESHDLVETLRATSGDIDVWRDFERARTEFQGMGLESVLELAEEEQLDASDIELLTEKVILEAWIERQILGDTRLESTRREDLDRILDQFRELDGELFKSAAARVIERCGERRPTSVSGEFAQIEHEAKKQRRHMPVRDLLDRAGSAARDLKPCFMMGPLSVSQFLPPTLKFDCVIFDEASQVKPADAINAIYRGRQLIIAGDERQLPPTSFFDRSVADDDEYDEEVVDDFESILNISKLGLQQLPLRWHYRSRHEGLISFSNREYYNSELITYPGAIQESPDLGVHFEHVPDGVYARGGAKDNIVEAKRVVERVIEHATQRPDLSVGVVAFSESQASRIAWELEAVRREEHPELDDYFAEDRLDGFFIKNLESVQGDERDIIIFSIGYGKDEHGKFTMNFGPVGKEGGHRRLNVAATRAKRRVEVVSSVRAADFIETSNPRVLSFKRYLDYAERGIAAFADDRSRSEETDSPFEQDVVEVIRDLGFEPHPQVGHAGYRIDIGVVHPDQPGRYAIGIECDGATYHSSRVARDRDRLRQDVLEGLGWTMYRIWSTSWFRDRAAEIAKLKLAIETAIVAPEPGERRIKRTSHVPEPQVVDFEPILAAWAEEYRPDLSRILPVPAFGDPGARSQMNELVNKIVQALAPAHLDQIELAVRQIQEFSAMGPARKQQVALSLRALTRNESVIMDSNGFYWAANGMRVSVRSGDPDDPETLRKAAHVCPDEVKLAIFFLAKDARSLSREDLMVQTARVFGWKRSGVDVQSLIAKALEALEKSGDIETLDNGLLAAGASEYPTLD